MDSKALMLGLILLGLCGCKYSAAAEFGTDHPKVLCDSQGQAWAVAHHIGNTFTVNRMKSADRACEALKTP